MPALRPLALFDFDGTLIPGDSIVALVRYARKRKVMSLRDFLGAAFAAAGYGLRLVSAEKSKNAALRFRIKLPEAERDALDRDFVKECLLPIVYEQGKACLERHRAEGRLLMLVTASTENYMRYAAEALGFPVLLATPLLPDGKIGENCKGEEKVRRIQDWLKEQGMEADFAGSWAYGDSKSDLPMLRLCGHPVQVNPKKALREAAPEMAAEEWEEKSVE